MTLLFESPIPLLAVGVIVAAIFGVTFLQTGKRWAAAGAVAAVLASVALLVVERLVVTPSEEVRATLHDLEQTLDANDLPGVISFIDPDAARVLSSANARLPGVKIDDARITTPIKVEVNEYGNPPTATAVFTGRIDVSGNFGGGLVAIEGQPYIRRFTLKLRRGADRWLIYDYSEADPLGR